VSRSYRSRAYNKAVQWIALNDNDGEDDPVDQLKLYLTVKLVADTWEKTCTQVAHDVWFERHPNRGIGSLLAQ